MIHIPIFPKNVIIFLDNLIVLEGRKVE